MTVALYFILTPQAVVRSSGSGGGGNAVDNGDGTITIGGTEGCDDPENGCD